MSHTAEQLATRVEVAMTRITGTSNKNEWPVLLLRELCSLAEDVNKLTFLVAGDIAAEVMREKFSGIDG